MAVYTEVSDAALAAYLSNYDLGETLSFKGVAGGVENTNYFLTTSKGRYILTLYEKRVAEADLPFFIGLMDHLAEAGFPCPMPIRNKHGQALGRLEGRPAALVSFLEGMEISTPTPEDCFNAGKTMAQLHLAAEGFDIRRTNALNPQGWPALFQSCSDRADEVEPGMVDLLRSELESITSNWPSDLPMGVIHADLFKDNVFFLHNKLSGVIDFYFACNDFFAYDLAIGLNAWCFDKQVSFLPEHGAQFVAGYQSERKLTEKEVEALPVLCRGAALRFLLTRVNDWLNVPPGALVVPHDPKEFSARLRFFGQQSTASEMGVL